MKTLFNVDNKILDYKDNNVTFHLVFRSNKVVIKGDSATGKTLLVNRIQEIKKAASFSSDIEIDATSIITYDGKELKNDVSFDGKKKLYIIDRADYLSEEIAKKIKKDRYNFYLIFTRVGKELGVPPISYGEFVNEGNVIQIKYDYDKGMWL